MRTQRGAAFLTALLLLSFLTLVGSAFLATSRVDVAISDNYGAHSGLGFLAEGGIEEARVLLAAAGMDLGSLLDRAAGADGVLETAPDLATRLASDDRPVLAGAPGRPHVFLQNDAADGAAAPTDTNGLVTLVSFVETGSRARRLEADLISPGPAPVAALLLAGALDPSATSLGGSLRVDGRDRCGGTPLPAAGVLGEAARLLLIGGIPSGAEAAFAGAGPPPDVADVIGVLPGVLGTSEGRQAWVDRLARVATLRPDPSSGPVRIGDTGAPDAPELVFVAGDAWLGPGRGYGVLMVTGDAVVMDGFEWHGLVVAGPPGRLSWEGGAEIYGAVWVAGGVGPLGLDLERGSGVIGYDSCSLEDAYRALPFSPVAFRER